MIFLSLYPNKLNSSPEVEVTQQISSVPLLSPFFRIIKTVISFSISHSYLKMSLQFSSGVIYQMNRISRIQHLTISNIINFHNKEINKLSFCSPKTSSIPTYPALWTGSPGLYKKGWVMEKGVWVNVSHCSVFCKHGHVISWPSLSFISWPSLSFQNPDSLSTKSSMFESPQTTDECVWYHSDKIKPQQPLSFWYW